MKGLAYILLGIGIAGVAGVTIYSASSMSNTLAKRKQKLVDQIFYKFGNPESPEYSQSFDASPIALMRYDENTLQKLLNGEIR